MRKVNLEIAISIQNQVPDSQINDKFISGTSKKFEFGSL